MYFSTIQAIIRRAIKLHHNSSQDLFQSYIEDTFLTPSNIKSWRSCPSSSDNQSGLSQQCTVQWAKESFHDALEYAYGDENGKEIMDGMTLSEEYMESRLEVVQRRLAAGGVRLAATLEKVFGEKENGEGVDIDAVANVRGCT